MKETYTPRKRKPISEVRTKKNYSGEASPYWDFAREHQDYEGNPMEDILANPDALSEDDTLYGRPLTVVGEMQLSAIRETLPKLSPRERQVVLMCTRTVDEISYDMGISPRTVRMLLERAKLKIDKCYRRKLLRESCSTLD